MKINAFDLKDNMLLQIIIVILLTLVILYVINYLLEPNYVETFNETILIEDCIYGKFKCFKKDQFICSSIIAGGAWEKHILDKILEYYIKDSNFLDIGSNYGCHSIGVANEIKKTNGKGKVYSFELQPEIFKLFKENVQLNGLEEIIIPQFFGLGDKNENKNFIVPNDYDVNANPGGLSFLNQNLDENSKNENSEIKRLDDLSIDNISVIKIDVEGYELEVFEGGKDTIQKNRPIIIIEIWNNNKEKYFDWIHTHFPFYKIDHIHADDYILIPS